MSMVFQSVSLKVSTPRIVLWVLLLGLSAGCTSIGLEPPDLTLVDLQLEDVTVLESSGVITLRIANSNPDPLQIDGLAINLKLDGRRVGKVLSSERLEIPRLSTATLDAELHVNHLAMLTLVQQIMESEAATYGFAGKVYVLTDFGRRSLRVEQGGRFDFNEDVSGSSEADQGE